MIEGNYNNKQVGNDDFKGDSALHTKAALPLQKYYFPLQKKQIEATSLAEATEKLNELLKQNTNKNK